MYCTKQKNLFLKPKLLRNIIINSKTQRITTSKIVKTNCIRIILDVNECEQTPAPCKFACTNTEGSFLCSCPKGYTLAADGVTCRDLDECATGQHNCEHECVNTLGSYKCSCPKGYTESRDKCIGNQYR